MTDIVIKVDKVSKQYRLGLLGSRTVADDLKRWWYSVRGKEDPFLKVGSENKLDTIDGEYIWALKDINFEVKRGEVLGIIGKNGAGKSTLLKLLSRVTSPSTGSISFKGRIASLLEVGTGFHPDLTGKENVYLNGAILGMTKAEIAKKFDEIVSFSGIGKYIDTPVKRYSSGMYVRLAFAVAAHLDPEILVVDEVLAVGDMEFQKKAIGKMGEISKTDGRTILFVSHNMDAVKNLCNRSILIEKGKITAVGPTSEIVQKYINSNFSFNINFNNLKDSLKGDNVVKVKDIKIIDTNGIDLNEIKVDTKFGVRVKYELLNDSYKPLLSFNLLTIDEKFICNPYSTFLNDKGTGIYESTVWVPANFLNNDLYMIGIGFVSEDNTSELKLNGKIHFYMKDAVIIDVQDDDNAITRKYFKRKYEGLIRPLFEWEVVKC